MTDANISPRAIDARAALNSHLDLTKNLIHGLGRQLPATAAYKSLSVRKKKNVDAWLNSLRTLSETIPEVFTQLRKLIDVNVPALREVLDIEILVALLEGEEMVRSTLKRVPVSVEDTAYLDGPKAFKVYIGARLDVARSYYHRASDRRRKETLESERQIEESIKELERLRRETGDVSLPGVAAVMDLSIRQMRDVQHLSEEAQAAFEVLAKQVGGIGDTNIASLFEYLGDAEVRRIANRQRVFQVLTEGILEGGAELLIGAIVSEPPGPGTAGVKGAIVSWLRERLFFRTLAEDSNKRALRAASRAALGLPLFIVPLTVAEYGRTLAGARLTEKEFVEFQAAKTALGATTRGATS